MEVVLAQGLGPVNCLSGFWHILLLMRQAGSRRLATRCKTKLFNLYDCVRVYVRAKPALPQC